MSAKVTVTGIDELVSFANRIVSGLDAKVLQPTNRENAQALVNEMKDRMHKRSFRMFNNTRVQAVTNGFAAIVDVPYAFTENRRPGNKRTRRGTGFGTPHRFVEPSIANVERNSLQKLMVRLGTFLQTG